MQNRNLNPDFQTPPSLAASEEHWQRMGGEARRDGDVEAQITMSLSVTVQMVAFIPDEVGCLWKVPGREVACSDKV